MSQQLVLDISTATARSKGQARRRTQPAQSEDARKAQRNLVRRERARCKKEGNGKQQLLPSVQPSPYADQPQFGVPVQVKNKAAQGKSKLPLQPHRPAFTVLPIHANDFNLRALAQSSRYLAAQSEAQDMKDIVRDDVRQLRGVNVEPAQSRHESRIVAEEQDRDAVETPVEFAEQQQIISTAADIGNISVNNGREPEDDASMDCSQNCPVASCEYHLEGFPLKLERDKHIKTHCAGLFKCGTSQYHCLESTRIFFGFQDLRDHVNQRHGSFSQIHDMHVCNMCYRDFRSAEYLEHFDDCILHTVEFIAHTDKLKASIRAQGCPLAACDHHHIDFTSIFHKEQHLLWHFWATLDYYYSDYDRFLNYYREPYSAHESKSYMSEMHGVDLSLLYCPVCLHTSGNWDHLLQHFGSSTHVVPEKQHLSLGHDRLFLSADYVHPDAFDLILPRSIFVLRDHISHPSFCQILEILFQKHTLPIYGQYEALY